jgi:hypothetical protein
MGNEKSKDEKIEIIKEEEYRRGKKRAFRAYLNIKNFLVEYLYGDKTISSGDKFMVYLIKTNSIPKFINILKETFKTVKTKEELEEAEKNLEEKLKDYELEKNVKIYDSYKSCLDIIQNKLENEFIIVREDFLNNLEIEDDKNKKVQIIEIDKNNHSMKIKFLASEKIIILEEIKEQRGYFQFSEVEEGTLVNQKESEVSIKYNNINNNINNYNNNGYYNDGYYNKNGYFDNKNKNYNSEENKVRKNISTVSNSSVDYYELNKQSVIINKDYNLKKDQLYESMIESIIYCLLNIKSLNDKFEDIKNNNKNIIKDKSFSLKFSNLISQKQYKNTLIACSNLIDSIKDLFINEPVIPIGNIYNLLHQELKQIDPNQNYMIITQDINKLDYKKELMNVSNKFKRNGISIISDLFYFPDITTITCQNCGRIFEYKSITNNNIVFPLKDVCNFKNLHQQLNINDCFDYLIRNKNIDKICPNCNRNNSSFSYYRISSTKEILTIILDRGKNFENDIFFNVHFNVNLAKYFLEQNSPQNYELIGFCSFYKNNNKCVPFYKYHGDNLWYYLDNSTINIVTQNLYWGSPFLLFYKKINN